MFNFLHPRPVVDGRPVVVQMVRQKTVTRQDTRTLIVATKTTGTSGSPSAAWLTSAETLPAPGSPR